MNTILTKIAPTLLTRICQALEVKPRELGRRLDLDYHAEIRPLIDAGYDRPEIDKDATWITIAAYVDDRLGGLMAIKRELTNALESERARRTMRVASQLERTKRSSPRS